MSRRLVRLFPLALALAGCAAMPPPAKLPDAAASLAAAESAFAAQSVREGMRAAFLAWLAPGALLFRDGAVDGPSVIAARPDPPIVLDWRPVFVEASATGDLGFSTGPWRVTARQDPSATPKHGQFFSVWRRAAGGPWRVEVDLGISHSGDTLWAEPLRAATTPAAGATPGSIAQAEARFAKAAAEDGDAAAYGEHASGSIRLYRDGHAPFLRREAALASPAASRARTAWTTESHATSRAGDLGYAWGRYGPPGGPVQGHYVRVWRREAGGWRIAADIVNALAQR